MLKLPLWIALAILAALLACGGQTPGPGGAVATIPATTEAATSAPAPETTNTPQKTVPTTTPESSAATTPLPANSPTPEPTAAPTPTEIPVPTESPNERPTAEPTSTPASTPTLEPTATLALDELLVPLQLQDPQMISELSEDELACIGDNPERLARSLTGQGPASREEQAEFIRCLEDETVARIFLAGFVPGPGPLSQESSGCVRAAFEVIEPRTVMTAGMDGDPGRAMAGSMAAFSVTMACLNDQEWEETAPQVGMGQEERVGMVCLMEALGGPGEMAAAMIAAGEGDFTDMARAGSECGLDMGPVPGQAPVTPPPPPTMEAPTPAPTPTTLTPSPTQVTSTATSTPAPETATTLVITIAAIPADIPDYDRSDWRHWVDADGDCQDARQEVLIAESLEPVTYESDRKCRVEAGRWWAPHLN